MRPIHVDPRNVVDRDLAPVVAWLRAGHIVIFPTDTFYGAAVDATNPAAVAALFDLKGRAADAALPFVAASRAQIEAAFGPLTGLSRRLADRFWPGPLSLVLDAPATIAPAALAGGATIAVRVPDHPVARALVAAFGAPLPATSANRSGDPAVRSAPELSSIASDSRVLVVDAGPSPGGAPSTIVDARREPPRLIRAGAVGWDRVLTSTQE